MFPKFLDDQAIEFQIYLAQRYKEIEQFKDAVSEVKSLANQLKQISGTELFQIQNYGKNKLNNVFDRIKKISSSLKTQKIKKIIQAQFDDLNEDNFLNKETEVSKEYRAEEKLISQLDEQDDLVFENNELALVEKIILMIQFEIDEDKKKEMWRVTREFHLEN